MKHIGERIKRKREQLNLNLADLARKVGVTPSALSQIENAKAHPSIITLKSIAENLHTTVGELIGEHESLGKNPVMHRKDIRFIEQNESGTSLYQLSHHDMNKNMDTYLLKFIKGSDLQELFAGYTGQVFSHILMGNLRFIVDGTDYSLVKGDNIYLNYKSLDAVLNVGEEPSEALWIISPANF
jgi:transcriptional regulator with XRE-family HTH domain